MDEQKMGKTEERSGHEQKIQKAKKERERPHKGRGGATRGYQRQGSRDHLEKLHVSPHVSPRKAWKLGRSCHFEVVRNQHPAARKRQTWTQPLGQEGTAKRKRKKEIDRKSTDAGRFLLSTPSHPSSSFLPPPSTPGGQQNKLRRFNSFPICCFCLSV